MTEPTQTSTAMTLVLAQRFFAAGLLDAAEENCRACLADDADHPDALWVLAAVLRRAERGGEALDVLTHLDRVRPDDGEVLNALGESYQSLQRYDEAAAAFARVAALRPDMAEAHYNLGIELRRQRRHVDAVRAFRAALAVDPALVAAHHNLGNALKDCGCPAEAVAAFDAALAIDPDFLPSHFNRLYTRNYVAGTTLADLYAAAEAFGARFPMPEKGAGPQDSDPERRLRIGYVSGDFRAHPVGLFIRPVIREHDRAAVEVTCYYNRAKDDGLTTILRDDADRWREVYALDDDALAARIAADGIDILVDLSGYTAQGRPMLFSRRIAPVQIAWIGSVGTTGLSGCDAFLGDAVGVRNGEEDWFTEQVVRLPNGWLCYDPPPYAPEVAPSPVRDNGFVTFGCLNNLAKVDAPTIAVWARVLAAVPGARLLLRNTSFSDAALRDQVAGRFADQGVDPEQLILLPPVPSDEALATYGQIDIALDPLTYSGGLTTCEALWMGVPVVTRGCGPTFASRHTESHLTNAGLTDWIARDEDGYVELARSLASNPDALADRRATLRAHVAASTLCDTTGFTRNLEAAYRALWQDYRSKV